jgi:hypothetical protein
MIGPDAAVADIDDDLAGRWTTSWLEKERLRRCVRSRTYEAGKVAPSRRVCIMCDHMAAEEREARWSKKRLDQLEAGDETPWYKVTGAPVEDENVPDWFSVPVQSLDTSRATQIKGRGGDLIPVDLW